MRTPIQNATHQVLRSSHQFEVFWAHTIASAAEVIPIEPFWWLADEEVVGSNRASTYRPELPIAVSIQRGNPEPTSISLLNLRPEAEFGINGRVSSGLWVENVSDIRRALQAPARIVHIAPATPMGSLFTALAIFFNRALTWGTLGRHRQLLSAGVRGRAVSAAPSLFSALHYTSGREV